MNLMRTIISLKEPKRRMVLRSLMVRLEVTARKASILTDGKLNEGFSEVKQMIFPYFL